ncbi:hypothetical protein AWW66_01120 [Micromonospora rosaria]|uniref:FAD-binding domain-containing protein n=1 Tax=Micromonospora rosaria TaxID=47874 RepID=A0A136PZF1_9ACTN|nr:FAD-dependent monooxygenase [Micromonospora rosaria]KXK63812.1 hypothetical protein AWW66_01120 [Micromonospora rosaria]
MTVLVVGAGPAGLALAAGLAGHGVRCRVVDRRPSAPAGTGCPNVWPRTQRALHLLGVDVEELRRSARSFTHKVWQPHDDPITIDIREDTDDGPWRVPFTVDQEILVAALLRRLAEHGVEVEWGRDVEALRPGGGGVRVRWRHGGVAGSAPVDWVVGADGAESTVRAAAGVGWEVTPFDQVDWVQRDVVVRAPRPLDPHTEYIFHAPRTHLGLVPLPGGRHRLFLAAPADGGGAPERLADPDRLAALLRDVSGAAYEVRAAGPAWSVRPRAALAETFRRGRCLLLGEAARVFPLPVQAMNTGVQDAANLAWKLAAVASGRADEGLLDTYTAERREVAAGLLARTGWLLTSSLEPEAVELFRAGYARRGGRPLVRTEPEVVLPPGRLVGGPGPAGAELAGRPLPDVPVVDHAGAEVSLAATVAGPWWTVLVLADTPVPPELYRRLRCRPVAPAVRVRVVGPCGVATGPEDLRDRSGRARRRLGTGLLVVRPDGYLAQHFTSDGGAAVGAFLTRALGGSDGR